MDDANHLLAEEELGEVVKAFLKTEVGKYIDGCSEQDLEDAKSELLKLDPYQFTSLNDLQSKLSEIQNKAKIANSIRSYLAEAIIKGNQATHQLSEDGND